MILKRWVGWISIGWVLLWGLWTIKVATAQPAIPTDVVVNFAALEEQPDVATLDVYFTVTDINGRPITNPNLDTATIRLLDGEGGDFPAVVEDPVTPIYIVLVLDASGSMSGIIEDARIASQTAIDSAPPNAYFAVIQFNEGWEVVEDFSNDIERVKAAIARVAVGDRGTCLYDTLYDVINLLDRQIQNQQDRRAIILFTDGKDQLARGSNAPCSRFYNNRDVTEYARSTLTPVHTIGLYDNTRTNLNEAELRTMTAETGAFLALGGVTDLNAMFQEIMDGLNSQLVARANVMPVEGTNSAVLSLTSPDASIPLNTTFTFSSSRAYTAPLPLPQFTITSVQYDADTDLYRLLLSIKNPQSVASIVASAWDTRSGIQISRDYAIPNPGPAPTIEIETIGFESGREYTFRILGIDMQENIIQDEEGNLLRAEAPVEYVSPRSGELTATIQSVNAEYVTQQLIIDLEVSNLNLVKTYDGFVVDEASGQRIHDFGPTGFTNPRIQEVLPEAIQNATIPKTYRVTVYLNTSDNQRLETVYDRFSPIPPEPPSQVDRIVSALKEYPLFLIAIVVIPLAVVAWLVLKNRSEKQKLPPPVRPPIDRTYVYLPPSHTATADDLLFDDQPVQSESTLVSVEDELITIPQLHIKIVKTPGVPTKQQEVVQKFPFLVGRQGCDFDIPGDGKISRQHLRFTQKGKRVFVQDLDSTNGTFVDGEKLEPSRSRQITGKHRVFLGLQTELELWLQ